MVTLKNEELPLPQPSKSLSENDAKDKDYIKKLTITDVKLKNGVLHSIGIFPIEKLSVLNLRLFITVNKLKTNRKRDRDSYLKIIESERVTYEKKHHLVVPKNASTRPTFASMDETLYRVMYVYFDESVREEVSQLGHQLTRAKLDTRSSNNDVYSKLLALYNNEDAVTDYPLEVCDEITIAEQVQSILKYIIHHYKKARTNKNISGQHDHISSYCNGKDWIVIFDDLLKESDDPILSSYCGGELPKDCFFSSLEKKKLITKRSNGVKRLPISTRMRV